MQLCFSLQATHYIWPNNSFTSLHHSKMNLGNWLLLWRFRSTFLEKGPKPSRQSTSMNLICKFVSIFLSYLSTAIVSWNFVIGEMMIGRRIFEAIQRAAPSSHGQTMRDDTCRWVTILPLWQKIIGSLALDRIKEVSPGKYKSNRQDGPFSFMITCVPSGNRWGLFWMQVVGIKRRYTSPMNNQNIFSG